MRYAAVLVSLSLMLAVPGRVWAGRCLGYSTSEIIWCDDFDNYCVGGATWPGYPPFPSRCPTDGTAVRDSGAFWANWTAQCSERMEVFDGWDPVNSRWDIVWNPPFGAVYQGTYDPIPIQAKFHTWNFVDAIQAKDPLKNAVNGSDAVPLKLQFFTYHSDGFVANSPAYFELSLDSDHAPTDYVMVDCSPEGQGPYPVICQQNRYTWGGQAGNPPAAIPPCPPLDTEMVYNALAFGFLAQLDYAPCNVETARMPTLYHPVVFDGNKWNEIRANVFPPSIGDFGLDMSDANDAIMFRVQIKSSTIFFEQSGGECPSFETCFATVPRLYAGPFNTISMGTGPGCELDEVTGDCKSGSTPHCFDYPVGPLESWKHSYLDTPVLFGGDLTSLNGACCLPDLSCDDQHDPSWCQANGGDYRGPGTTCATTLCCHDPFADADGDGDVDQADFGLWQVCYDGGAGLIAGCECYDRVSPAGVDGADFTAFANCFSGATVPADPNCD